MWWEFSAKVAVSRPRHDVGDVLQFHPHFVESLRHDLNASQYRQLRYLAHYQSAQPNSYLMH